MIYLLHIFRCLIETLGVGWSLLSSCCQVLVFNGGFEVRYLAHLSQARLLVWDSTLLLTSHFGLCFYILLEYFQRMFSQPFWKNLVRLILESWYLTGVFGGDVGGAKDCLCLMKHVSVSIVLCGVMFGFQEYLFKNFSGQRWLPVFLFNKAS